MHRLCSTLFLAALSAGCTRDTVQSLAVVWVQVEVGAACRADGGKCDPPSSKLRQPFCGYSVSPLDAGMMEAHLAGTGATGVVVVDTELLEEDGGRSSLESRREIVSAPWPVATAFASEELYRLGLNGAFLAPTSLSSDAGLSGGPVDAGLLVVRYVASDSSHDITETHRLSSVESRDVLVHDHSDEPFYGCCSHLGWGAQAVILAPLVALRLLRRRRR